MARYLRIFFGISLLLILVLFCLFLYFRRDRTSTTMQSKTVFVLRTKDHFTLYRNGQPFFIKGAAGSGNLAELRLAGGNTLRTWDTTNIRHILDEAEANGIAVIVGLSLPVSLHQSFYRDTAQVGEQFRAYQHIVKQYSSHPALLMWCLGNEIDFPYRPSFRSFYKAYNDLLKMIHYEDPDHPVTTALANFSRRCVYNIKIKVPDLDLIAINTFGRISILEKELQEFKWFWNGPFFISEWGINGPWESEATAWGAPIENTSIKKAEQYLERAKFIPNNDPRFLGACCFYWGQKQEGTHTWYNFFSPGGEKNEIVSAMEYLWKGKQPAHHSPPVKYMLIGQEGARDNILLKPDSIYTAKVIMENSPAGDSIYFRWELLQEDWFRKNIQEANLKKPRSFDSLLLSYPGIEMRFRTPSVEGPYRVFVTIYDKKGYFSTANTPFYVVEK